MSQKSLAALTRLYRRWSEGDWSEELSIFDPHFVAVLPDPYPSAHFGLEATRDYMRRFLDSWNDMRMEAESFQETGDSVVVGVHRTGTGSGSGARLEDRVFHVWTFRGSTAIRMEVFERESEALEAVGLSE